LQTKILQGIELLSRSEGQRLIHHAEGFLSATLANLARSHPELKRVVAAGDSRRGCELVRDLAIVAEAPAGGETHVLEPNDEVRLWVTEAGRYGPALLAATGSGAHVTGLQEIAAQKGLRLDGSGLYRNGRLVPRRTEEQVYRALGLAFVPPELREGRGELERAREGLMRLVTDGDLKGLLHATRSTPTVATLSRRWLKRRAGGATATSGWPTIPGAPGTPAA
jgi:DNA polymerase (family 10)